jgi:hypothetical protein
MPLLLLLPPRALAPADWVLTFCSSLSSSNIIPSCWSVHGITAGMSSGDARQSSRQRHY